MPISGVDGGEGTEKTLRVLRGGRASCPSGRGLVPGMPAQAAVGGVSEDFNKKSPQGSEVPLQLPPWSVFGLLVGLGVP